MRRHMFISVGVLTLATVWLYRLDILSVIGLSVGLLLSVYYLKQSLTMVRTLTNTSAKALLKSAILYLVLFMLGSIATTDRQQRQKNRQLRISQSP